METEYLVHHGILGMRWGVRRYQNKDGSLTAAGKKRLRTEDYHADYKNAHDKKSVKTMSTSELKKRNDRLQAERQYSNLTRKTSTGKKIVTAFVSTAATITAVTSAAKVYKGLGDKAVSGIGDWVIKDINKGLAKGLHG